MIFKTLHRKLSCNTNPTEKLDELECSRIVSCSCSNSKTPNIHDALTTIRYNLDLTVLSTIKLTTIEEKPGKIEQIDTNSD
jgi:hypothetical protein